MTILKRGSFLGEAIRRVVFFLMCASAAIVYGLIALIGLPIMLGSRAIDVCQISNNPFRTVASFLEAAAREAFSVVVLIAFLPVDLEKLDPSVENCIQGSIPVLLVHGFLGSSSNWIFLRKQLLRAGTKNIFSVNLGDPRLSIDAYTDVIGEKIKKIKAMTACGQVILVGHSMGGLVCKNYAHSDPTSIRTIVNPSRRLTKTIF